MIADPSFDPFEQIHSILERADLRFANLESTLSEQAGETVSPSNNLVFTAPPVGADLLRRAGFDIVSTANNHAWDYGKSALLETLTHLDRVGVAHVGTGSSLAAAESASIFDLDGFRIAFLAATDIWNQGSLAQHPARDFVARADRSTLINAVRSIRSSQHIDAIVVSIHGGEEYRETPHEPMRTLMRALIDAGADAVLGHHPHVPQGIELHDGKPIFYSLGNLRMSMHSDHPETGLGLLARITFSKDRKPTSEVCPFRTVGMTPVPLRSIEANQQAIERATMAKLATLGNSLGPSKAILGNAGDDGCFPLSPAHAATTASSLTPSPTRSSQAPSRAKSARYCCCPPSDLACMMACAKR
ncbi:MAG: CapA family protein [Polyangiaceae bacterium]